MRCWRKEWRSSNYGRALGMSLKCRMHNVRGHRSRAKAEEVLGLLIACVPDFITKVEKLWIYTKLKWVRIGCIDGYNLNVDSFYMLSGNEQLDNSIRTIYVNGVVELSGSFVRM